MSIQLIQQYYSKVEQVIRYGGSRNEQSLRKPFQDLLEQYARAKNLVLVAEVELTSRKGTRIRPDGTLKDALRQDWGFWESKDEKDVLADEIAVKIAKGYPTFNILFEDTHTAVLFQGGEEVLRSAFADAAGLDRLLTLFINYEPREVREFHKAIELFSAEIGGLAEALRAVIGEQLLVNKAFTTALDEFLALAKNAINPNIQLADVREMIIQHVLTEDIFMRVFDEAEFHRENVIAHKLAEVAGTFYRGETKRNIHARIAPYYETINAKASQISDHHEKQKFLKALYENFYKAYNPKAADRLGIVYTPDEIVRFMIESADHLTWQHFGKGLGERGVEILDPATGTGTFISELIEYLPPAQLEYKYEHELHCNEVAILPYYIANLNIEYTFKQKTGHYKEFNNICFVDTLDNMGFEHTGQQLNFFGLTDANAERITRQNSRPIMVVIGNPPYNANQANENDNNKNREYAEIDERIKNTYVKLSSAQKTKVYDMYSRFFRWASDRLSKDGLLAFITNNSFVNAHGFDGFRKSLQKEFDEIWVLDLGGNVREKESGNVFGIKLGIAISFCIKNSKHKGDAKIFYAKLPFETAHEKLQFLSTMKFENIEFKHITPDKDNNWINTSNNNFDTLLSLASKSSSKTIFNFTSNGISTNRDEWVYDFSYSGLAEKAEFFINEYNHEVDRWINFKKENLIVETTKESNPIVDNFLHERNIIKWSKMIKRDKLRKGKKDIFQTDNIRYSLYRPFTSQYIYFGYVPIDLKGKFEEILPVAESKNVTICITGADSAKPFMTLATDKLPDLHLVGAGAGTQCLPLYRYSPAGERSENITDWALAQFRKQYGPHPPAPSPKSGEGEQTRQAPVPPLRSLERGLGGEVHGKRSAPYELWEKLKPLARQMRHEPTQAENRLWQNLRNRQIKNAKFRRQHAIDRFIVDFYCPEFSLVIEADGEIHQYSVEEDARRQQYLESQGLRVLRFSNDEILNQTENVMTQIAHALADGAENKVLQREISKSDIFHYVYAVLHYPAYRAKYEQNLKREFPRIPFYEDFWQWAAWGERLMTLHLGYETLEPWALERIDRRGDLHGRPVAGDNKKAGTSPAPTEGEKPTPRLMARKANGIIEVDSVTTLQGIPAEAWEYHLGTYSALEWVLERYKEKKPKDPTIAEKFNHYKFADYKEQVISLLGRVCRVSVETVKIIGEMP